MLEIYMTILYSYSLFSYQITVENVYEGVRKVLHHSRLIILTRLEGYALPPRRFNNVAVTLQGKQEF